MEKAEKIKVFKGTLDSIELFLKLLEANIKHDVKFSQNSSEMYYKIKQTTNRYKKVEYHVEYLSDYDVIRLDIHCSLETAKYINSVVKSTLKPSSKINIEQFKNNVTYNSYFKFKDISQINSIAMLMIEIEKE